MKEKIIIAHKRKVCHIDLVRCPICKGKGQGTTIVLSKCKKCKHHKGIKKGYVICNNRF